MANDLPRGSVPSRKALEEDLRKLHRRGLHAARVDDLPALLDIARVLSSKRTDAERVEDALALGTDEFDQPRRDVVRLWFGLEVEGARDTRALPSSKRHQVAWKRWKHGAESTFRTHWTEDTYIALAKHLLTLRSSPVPPAAKSASEQKRGPDEPSPFMLWARVSYSITRELLIVFRMGISEATRLGGLPTLTAIADAAYPHTGTSVEKVEALASWACVESESGTNLRWLSNLELAGLGMQRDMSLEQRRRAALQIVGYPDKLLDDFQRSAAGHETIIAYNMSETLWKLGTEEGVDCGPPAWADPRLQSK